MQAIIIFSGVVALIWGFWKLGEPWRKYYENHIAPLELEVSSLEELRSEKCGARAQIESSVKLFKRNFRAEIRKFQEMKNEAYEELEPLRIRKSQLHNEMDDVRSKLNSWHRHSKSFWGNKKQNIKDDSILGWFGLEQTLAQKKNLETRRDTVSAEIYSLKGEISKIYEGKIKPAKNGIKATYDDWNCLKRYLKESKNEQYFSSKLEKLNVEISKIDDKISRLKNKITETKAAYKRQPEI